MSIKKNEQEEIKNIRSEISQTRRAISPALEEILFEPIKVLDHGFIRVVDYMGIDSSIVQAARVSYGKGTKKSNLDRGLIHYLLRHKHTTPFEMCDIKFHIKLPIFVARQWVRHRTASINEYSARYSILGKEFYIPQKEHLAVQSNINRQGRGNILNDNDAARVLELLKHDSEQCYQSYEEMLNEDEHGNPIDQNKQGLTRELARMNLTLNYYTEWYWKTNLHNLMHFCKLRADSHAQYEIQVYANVLIDIMEKWVPITHEAFMEYLVNAHHFSGNAFKLIKKLINNEKINFEMSNMSKREWNEFCNIFDIKESA